MEQVDEKLADRPVDKSEETTHEETESLQPPSTDTNVPPESDVPIVSASPVPEANSNNPIAGPSHLDLGQLNATIAIVEGDMPAQTPSSLGEFEIKIDENGDKMLDDYVVIDKKDICEFRSENQQESFYDQIENYLKLQLDKCDHYKKVFEQQHNPTMANQFVVHAIGTEKMRDLLKRMRTNGQMPKISFQHVSFSCLPTNVDVKEKEVQIVVRTADLPVANEQNVYVIAEFEFPHPKEESLTDTVGRWLHYMKIDPRNVILCSHSKSRQLDIITATDLVPFTHPDSKLTEYSRPISFFVDKGKSRTLKRKFKPVKLTFYERRGFFKMDKKLGVVQVKIDEINDEITSIVRLPLMDGRRQTEAAADIKVKVREPLVNKSLRVHEEKMLILY